MGDDVKPWIPANCVVVYAKRTFKLWWWDKPDGTKVRCLFNYHNKPTYELRPQDLNGDYYFDIISVRTGNKQAGTIACYMVRVNKARPLPKRPWWHVLGQNDATPKDPKREPTTEAQDVDATTSLLEQVQQEYQAGDIDADMDVKVYNETYIYSRDLELLLNLASETNMVGFTTVVTKTKGLMKVSWYGDESTFDNTMERFHADVQQR